MTRDKGNASLPRQTLSSEPEDRSPNACWSNASWDPLPGKAEGWLLCGKHEDGTFTVQVSSVSETQKDSSVPLLPVCSLHNFTAFFYNFPTAWQRALLADTPVQARGQTGTGSPRPQPGTPRQIRLYAHSHAFKKAKIIKERGQQEPEAGHYVTPGG